MAIPKGYRFPIEFSAAFPLGLVLVGEIAPDTEYQSREDRAAGRQVRQRVDETTGKRQWKATVTDPSEQNAKRASFEVTFVRMFSRCRLRLRCCRVCDRWSWKG
jgi:hypothetical protein